MWLVNDEGGKSLEDWLWVHKCSKIWTDVVIIVGLRPHSTPAPIPAWSQLHHLHRGGDTVSFRGRAVVVQWGVGAHDKLPGIPALSLLQRACGRRLDSDTGNGNRWEDTHVGSNTHLFLPVWFLPKNSWHLLECSSFHNNSYSHRFSKTLSSLLTG